MAETMSSDSTNASESARSSLDRFLVPSGSISKSHSQPQLHRSSHRSSTTDEDISFMDDEVLRLPPTVRGSTGVNAFIARAWTMRFGPGFWESCRKACIESTDCEKD